MAKEFHDDVFIWQRPDGGVSVTRIVKGANNPGESDAAYIQRTVEKIGVPYKDISLCKKVTLSEADAMDRTDRHQWKFDALESKGITKDKTIRSKAELVAEAKKSLDDELQKLSPDPISAIKLKQALETVIATRE